MRNLIEGMEIENEDLTKLGIFILALSTLMTDYSFLIITPVIVIMIVDVVLNNLDSYKKQLGRK